MTGSARHVTPAVYRAPAELLEVHPDLPRCDWDDPTPIPIRDEGGDQQ
jgi:hypothetical protein